MEDKIQYVHSPATHNTRAAKAFLPILIREIGMPKSVVDVGCGTGTWLSVFKSSGVEKILGIDGSNVELDQLHIDISEFKVANLTLPLKVNEYFELALCLEVAEHLPETASEVLIDSLCRLSDTILFSAALPQQGGQNHINEQFCDYWQKKFNRRGYLFNDVFRSLVWENDCIDSWYRQNMFLVKRVEATSISQNPVNSYYHPEIFNYKSASYQKALNAKIRLTNGEIGIPSAFKILLKAIANSFVTKKGVKSPIS